VGAQLDDVGPLLVHLPPRSVPSPHHHFLCRKPGALERWECAAFVERIRQALRWRHAPSPPPGRPRCAIVSRPAPSSVVDGGRRGPTLVRGPKMAPPARRNPTMTRR
jgi:hypothetical protein